MWTLNNRELASVIWLGGFLLYFLASSASIRSSLIGLIKTALHPKLAAAFGFMTAYMSAVVYLLYQMEVWQPFLLKTTLVWFLFTGVATAVRTIGSRDVSADLSEFLADNIKIIIFIEFLAGTYTFSLPIEFVLVFLLAVVAMLDVVAKRKDKYSSVAKLTTALLAGLGLFILASAVVKAVTDISTVASLDSLREALLAPGLAITFIPCIYLLALYSNYELLWTRLTTKPRPSNDVALYALRRFLLTCGINTGKVGRLLQEHPGLLTRITSREEVDKFITEYL